MRPERFLISYATTDFRKSQERLGFSALRHGVDKVFSYTPDDLKKKDFFRENRDILEMKRGAGYWLWKPFFILETLKSIPVGSILIYADADAEIIADLEPLFLICENQEGRVLFSNDSRLNRAWTKRDCFVLMGCDTEEYWNSEHLMGGFLFFMTNSHNEKFVSEWLTYCSDIRILSDRPNVCGLPNFPEFIEHRHDQSVLSILAKKHSIEIYRDPSQWGNPYKLKQYRIKNEFIHKPYCLNSMSKSPYPTLITVNRAVRPSLFNILKKRILKYSHPFFDKC